MIEDNIIIGKNLNKVIIYLFLDNFEKFKYLNNCNFSNLIKS